MDFGVHSSLSSPQSSSFSAAFLSHMELSGQLSPKHGFIFARSWTFPRNPPKLNMVSCRARTFESPRVPSNTNLYEVLSLESKNVGVDEIKKAYRSMARQYHPDVVHPSRKEESTQMFVQVQRAYETLSNPVSRQKYDFEVGYLSRCGGTNNSGKDTWADQLSGLEFKSSEKKRTKQQRAGACV